MFTQKIHILNISLLILFSPLLIAKEKAKIGVTWSVSASGFFSPDVDEMIAKKVLSDSPADKAGMKAGDKVLSIEGCEIPGCSADEVKGFFKQETKESINLIVESQDGTTKSIVINLG